MKLIPRRYFMLMTIVWIVLELFALLLCWSFARTQVRDEIYRDACVAGSILISPDDAGQWTPITGKTDAQYEAGAQELERYGYGRNMRLELHEDFKHLFVRMSLIACGSLFAAYIMLALCILGLMLRVDRRIEHMVRCVNEDGEPRVRYGVSSLDRLSLALHEQYARRMSSGERAIKDRRYMKDLLADMSHQLKTPLASMRMYVELMQRTPDMDAATRERFLSESMSQLDRTEWLVQGLLKMARLEAGAVKFNVRPANIDDALELAAAPFKLSASVSGTGLTVQGCGKVFPHDTDWLAEAIGNLIKNALEHTPGGNVCVRAVATPLTLEISVSDDGEGVSMDVLPHLFERFYSRRSSARTGSVGLGLALAKEIVTQSGGTISVESELGHGTTFNIVFLLNQ